MDVYGRVHKKWEEDTKVLPLTRCHKEIYLNIHTKYFEKLKKFPNLLSPQDFNDKIQWLKLFDQNRISVDCADKIKVRDHISKILGDGYTPNIYFQKSIFSFSDVQSLPKTFVLKVNNDSGTVFVVRDKDKVSAQTWQEQVIRFNESLSYGYGWSNGEWMYSYILPAVFAEEFIDPGKDTIPADYKFHCVNGKIKWLQYVQGRGGARAQEVNVDVDGKPLGFLFNPLLEYSENFTPPANFEEMKVIAEKLAEGWKYVRVDLYSTNSKIYVGEITFHPLGGFINTEGQKIAGKYLDFSCSDFSECVAGILESENSRFKIYKKFK